jgi:hypothetical protein
MTFIDRGYPPTGTIIPPHCRFAQVPLYVRLAGRPCPDPGVCIGYLHGYHYEGGGVIIMIMRCADRPVVHVYQRGLRRLEATCGVEGMPVG